MYERLVVVTRKTRLDELVQRFNTSGQARFYLEHAGGHFADYQQEHDTYQRSLDQIRRAVAFGLPCQFLDRGLVPTYTFDPTEVVVVLGQDGLVANAAKYAGDQPIVGINPDPTRFDGVLLPFGPAAARSVVAETLKGRARTRAVTLAEALLADGQRLLAFNDLFIGARTHVSARYHIRAAGMSEAQSSSGIIVATGAGSTGWMSSVFNMAAGVTAFAGGSRGPGLRLEWEDGRLIYAVREPFVSRHSAASIVAGLIEPREELGLESLMPTGGVIFSDGIESDFLTFDAGATCRISAAAQRAHLVVPSD
jgi:NAD kinase